MKKLVTLIAISISVLWCAPSQADSPSFTYVGFEYVGTGNLDISVDRTSVDLDLDGYALTGSVELGIFFFQASQFELETEDFLGGNIEDSITMLAAGITFELPQTQVYGLIRGRRDDLSLRVGGFSLDDDLEVAGVEAGVRVNLTNRLELNANLGVPAIDDGTSYGVGAQFFVTDNVGITLDFRRLEFEEDDIEAEFDTTSIGVRFSF